LGLPEDEFPDGPEIDLWAGFEPRESEDASLVQAASGQAWAQAHEWMFDNEIDWVNELQG
jgi:hypothetical protein